ncbi:MAG: Cu(I)-responsive transcriptional regulator [Candidatus Sericytochromatia bacterium]|nr:Cu(I)-responsive transcriptional regulator [Candidatus Sericytochromatia bacterium]
MKNHSISAAAKASGVNAKMIRYYESIGVIPPAERADNGYRQYSAQDIYTLRFVRRARNLGFSLEDIQQLVGLWQNQSRASAEVKALAEAHMQRLQAKIAELQGMHDTLKTLSDACHGDQRPDCPILQDLAGAAGASAKQLSCH